MAINVPSTGNGRVDNTVAMLFSRAIQRLDENIPPLHPQTLIIPIGEVVIDIFDFGLSLYFLFNKKPTLLATKLIDYSKTFSNRTLYKPDCPVQIRILHFPNDHISMKQSL